MITPEEVFKSVVIYGIVHGIWVAIKRASNWLVFKGEHLFNTERDHIVRAHIKDGHKGHLKFCQVPSCLWLRHL